MAVEWEHSASVLFSMRESEALGLALHLLEAECLSVKTLSGSYCSASCYSGFAQTCEVTGGLLSNLPRIFLLQEQSCSVFRLSLLRFANLYQLELVFLQRLVVGC